MRNMKPSIIREILKQMSDPSLISFAGGQPRAGIFPGNEDIARRVGAHCLRQDPAGALQYSVTGGRARGAAKPVRRFANRRELRVREGRTTRAALHPAASRVLDLRGQVPVQRGRRWRPWKSRRSWGRYNAFRS